MCKDVASFYTARKKWKHIFPKMEYTSVVENR